jgi:hypothetical protein
MKIQGKNGEEREEEKIEGEEEVKRRKRK